MGKAKLIIDDQFVSLMEQIDQGELQSKDCAEMLNVTPSALCQARSKWKRQQPLESVEALSPQRQVFVQAKVNGASNREAAKIAYPDAQDKSLSVIASQIMKEPDTQTAIGDLMAQHGLTRSFRVSRLRDCTLSPDLNVVLKSLDQSWKLDGSYAAEKLDVSVTDTDIRALIRSIAIPSEAPECIDITPR